MKRVLTALAAAALIITLGACTSTPGVDDSAAPTAYPTPDQSLVPKAPAAGLVDVDAAGFSDQFGEYIFKVGDGPTWCTISPAIEGDTSGSGGNVICEQNEAAALYKPIPIPADCDYSFGYQIRLMGVDGAVEGAKTADFTCASGFYADPRDAPVLASGQQITVAPFRCFVEDVNVRCENEGGQYIALGPKVWSLGN